MMLKEPMTSEIQKPGSIANEEFRRLARIYSWDMRENEALKWPERLLRRVMDMGTLEDVVSMQEKIPNTALEHALVTSEAGGMRRNSWVFWHLRLGLINDTSECRPYPERRFE